jgi:hypothetical protein
LVGLPLLGLLLVGLPSGVSTVYSSYLGLRLSIGLFSLCVGFPWDGYVLGWVVCKVGLYFRGSIILWIYLLVGLALFSSVCAWRLWVRILQY